MRFDVAGVWMRRVGFAGSTKGDLEIVEKKGSLDSQAMVKSKALNPVYVCSISRWLVVRVVCVYGEGVLVICRWTGG